MATQSDAGRNPARPVIIAYLSLGGLFTLGASLIWAINTMFLIRVGGLDLFQTMVVNGVFTVAQMVFEVPTGVVADTIGRRASIMISMVTLAFSTALYVLVPRGAGGSGGSRRGSVLLGLGYTFQTGAIDAWLVDALDDCGWEQPKERVFAWGQIAASSGMLIGSLLGGLLGQVNLALPYIVRAVILVACFVVAVLLVQDWGFEPRPLKWSTFGAETRRIVQAGTRYGWRSPVVRPHALGVGDQRHLPHVRLLRVAALRARSARQGLHLAARDRSGSVVGSGHRGQRLRRPDQALGRALARSARVLEIAAIANTVLIAAIGAVGLVARAAGRPAGGHRDRALARMGRDLRYQHAGAHVVHERAHRLDGARDGALARRVVLRCRGAVGQPAFGWLSARASIAAAWTLGAAFVGMTVPLYRRSGRAAKAAEEYKHQHPKQPPARAIARPWVPPMGSWSSGTRLQRVVSTSGAHEGGGDRVVCSLR